MAEKNGNETRVFVCTVEEWLNLQGEEGDVILGSPENPIVRPMTKNLIEASEKCFKTTFTLRLMLGLSCGITVFPALPVVSRGRVLYLHGELSNAEIKERTQSAVAGLEGPFDLKQGKAVEAHLIEERGRVVIQALIEKHEPEHVVFDPWQSFIAGYDENTFKDVSAAEKFCDALIEKYGVTLWIPIHLGKDPKKGARGHSSIAGWRDTRIALGRDGNLVGVTVEPRWAEAPPRFHLRFEDKTLKPDTSGPLRGQSAAIRAFVESRGGKVLRAEVVKHLGKSEDTARKAIERAVKAKVLILEGEYILVPLTPETDTEAKPN